MRKLKIGMLVLLCLVTAGLCGIFAYGMTGHSIYVTGYNSMSYGSGYDNVQLVLEKEVPLDKIDSISVLYNMNNNDIFLYESDNDSLTIEEYSEIELSENEISAVRVKGSSVEIEGKRRNTRSNSVRIGMFGIRSAVCYTKVGLPSSYKGELVLTTSSGDISSQTGITLEKDFRAATSSGDVSFPAITAANVSLGCSSGDVRVETVDTSVNDASGEICISTTSGDINVKQLTGETEIASSSGTVRVETISGNAQFASTSGDISVQCIDGAAAIGTSSGGVRLYGGSGDRTITTSSGDVLLEGVDGTWDIGTSSGEAWVKAQKGSGYIRTTSGDIRLELKELTGELKLDSSSGDAKVTLSAKDAFDFSANTTSGDINTFFDEKLSFSKRGNNARGTYGDNAQGNRIQIETTSGDVRVMEN